MKLKSTMLAVALAALGSSALALDGTYTSGEVSMTFAADGAYTVVVQGAAIPGTYKVEGDTVTIKATDPDQFCMGAEGVYTLAETVEGATFTTVNDPCTQRATAMAATWAKKAE